MAPETASEFLRRIESLERDARALLARLQQMEPRPDWHELLLRGWAPPDRGH